MAAVSPLTPNPAPAPAFGDGPVRPVSVSLQKGTSAALKAHTGKRGMSAYVEVLIQRQLPQERLREFIECAEAEHGSVGQSAVDAKRAILRGDTADSANTA